MWWRVGYLSIRVWSSNAVSGAALHPISPLPVCSLGNNPQSWRNHQRWVRLTMRSKWVRAAPRLVCHGHCPPKSHSAGSPTHSQLLYGLLVAQSFIPHWKFLNPRYILSLGWSGQSLADGGKQRPSPLSQEQHWRAISFAEHPRKLAEIPRQPHWRAVQPSLPPYRCIVWKCS